MQFDAEQPDRRAIVQPGLRRIIGVKPRRDVERGGSGRGDEARLSLDNRRPRIAGTIHAGHDDEGKLLVKVAVLVGHEVADDARTHLGHALGHAQPLLQEAFALVPYRLSGGRGVGVVVHRPSPG